MPFLLGDNTAGKLKRLCDGRGAFLHTPAHHETCQHLIGWVYLESHQPPNYDYVWRHTVYDLATGAWQNYWRCIGGLAPSNTASFDHKGYFVGGRYLGFSGPPTFSSTVGETFRPPGSTYDGGGLDYPRTQSVSMPLAGLETIPIGQSVTAFRVSITPAVPATTSTPRTPPVLNYSFDWLNNPNSMGNDLTSATTNRRTYTETPPPGVPPPIPFS